jgi:fluoride exporter
MHKLLWIAAAGALGTLARYALSGWVQKNAGTAFPWGTLAVNALGCFLFGLVWALCEERLLIRPEVRMIVLVGFMGAFTTFSTFAFETGEFLNNGQWLMAAANIVVQNVSGVVCILLGWAAARLI